ncbi:hypothetical protein T07_9502 [Trichinella nelsoni]|uniref:Uncharacterized protein n=1 Tax=Trichinella nelsoni TaxID=6336 RepID=A0A0V0SE32_9BILA|nr:hypothetical protein T07_9502 [Trichinella nelsoni]
MGDVLIIEPAGSDDYLDEDEVDRGRQRDTCLVTFGVNPGRRLGQLTGLLAVVSQLISWLVGIEAIVPVE